MKNMAAAVGGAEQGAEAALSTLRARLTRRAGRAASRVSRRLLFGRLAPYFGFTVLGGSVELKLVRMCVFDAVACLMVETNE